MNVQYNYFFYSSSTQFIFYFLPSQLLQFFCEISSSIFWYQSFTDWGTAAFLFAPEHFDSPKETSQWLQTILRIFCLGFSLTTKYFSVYSIEARGIPFVLQGQPCIDLELGLNMGGNNETANQVWNVYTIPGHYEGEGQRGEVLLTSYYKENWKERLAVNYCRHL